MQLVLVWLKKKITPSITMYCYVGYYEVLHLLEIFQHSWKMFPKISFEPSFDSLLVTSLINEFFEVFDTFILYYMTVMFLIL